jgi:cyclophilin family peptidyl-prolyl cis-trans isomerase/protein-disulfide isomerase
MKKYAIITTFLFTILLSACNGTLQTASIPTTTNNKSLETQPLASIPLETCLSLSANSTPNVNAPSLFPEINEHDHIIGRDDAATTITIYNDFKSEYGKHVAYVLSSLYTMHPADLRIVFRSVVTDDTSEFAARSAEAAAIQGKFWELHDYLFNNQNVWKGFTSDQFKSWINANSTAAGLDADRFVKDFESQEISYKVEDAKSYWTTLAQSIAETGQQLYAPLLLINGKPLTVIDPNALSAMIEQTVLMNSLIKKQFVDCPKFVIEPDKEYIATLKTEKGDIVIQLFPDKAPNTVNNFVFLAQNGWYDNITFHRVIPGYVAQTGDPSGTGLGNPGFYINNEISSTLKYDKPGVVGMANSGPDTNGSQFFIALKPAPELDGAYTIFGQVISGMDVLEALNARDPKLGVILAPGDKLISVTIEEH